MINYDVYSTNASSPFKRISIIQERPWGTTFKILRHETKVPTILKSGTLINEEVKAYLNSDIIFKELRRPRLLSFGDNWIELEFLEQAINMNPCYFNILYFDFQKSNLVNCQRRYIEYSKKIDNSKKLISELFTKHTIHPSQAKLLVEICNQLFLLEQRYYRSEFLCKLTTACHGDLHTGNIIFSNKIGYYLIDWSDFLFAPPGFCLSSIFGLRNLLISTSRNCKIKIFEYYRNWVKQLTQFDAIQVNYLFKYLAAQAEFYKLSNLAKYYFEFDSTGHHYFNRYLYSLNAALKSNGESL